jgi:signal peptidase
MRRHLYTLLVVAGLVGWFLLLRPLALGGPATYVMVSGTSMQPTFYTGDLVVLQKQQTYHKGEVIAYAVPKGEIGAGQLIIHRIVGGSQTTGLVTQGDNRDQPDDWHPTTADVKGTLWVKAPGVGKVFAHLRQPPIFAAIAGGFAVFSLLMREPASRKENEASSGDAGQGSEVPEEAVAR